MTETWKNPTKNFSILEPQNPWIYEIYVVRERRVTDFKAPKLLKGAPGRLLQDSNPSAMFYSINYFYVNELFPLSQRFSEIVH